MKILGEGTVSGQSADVASALTDEEVDLVVEAGARQTLAEVEAALAKLKTTAYGICEDYGTPIALDRLRVVPWTTLRVGCARERG